VFALDALMFPIVIDEHAQVQSPCPHTNKKTRHLDALRPQGVLLLQPEDAVISLVSRGRQRETFEVPFVATSSSLPLDRPGGLGAEIKNRTRLLWSFQERFRNCVSEEIDAPLYSTGQESLTKHDGPNTRKW